MMMTDFVKKFYFKPVAFVVLAGMLIIGCTPAKSLAFVVGTNQAAGMTESGPARAEDMARVQRVLEAKEVRAKLTELGLGKEEIDSRLARLSDAELHSFASQLDSLYPGGGFLGFVAGILIIVILVLLILKLTDRKIIVK